MLRPCWFVVALVVLVPLRAQAEPATIKVRVTGLFAPDRQADLRAVINEWSDIKLVSLDFNHAEAQLSLDAAKLYPKATTAQVIIRLDEKLRQETHGLFGIKPATETPRDKLRRVEIPVAGLDCKACCLAAYEI